MKFHGLEDERDGLTRISELVFQLRQIEERPGLGLPNPSFATQAQQSQSGTACCREVSEVVLKVLEAEEGVRLGTSISEISKRVDYLRKPL
jgi:hypothetical protein